jgi:Na+/H+-dicarboxylate symporter
MKWKQILIAFAVGCIVGSTFPSIGRVAKNHLPKPAVSAVEQAIEVVK